MHVCVDLVVSACDVCVDLVMSACVLCVWTW